VKHRRGKAPIFVLLAAVFLFLIAAAVDGQTRASMVGVLDRGFRGEDVSSPQANLNYG